MQPFLRILSVVSALALLTTGVTAVAPSTNTSVRWSDDPDDCTVDTADTDALGQLASCTDITYTIPPTTAEGTTKEAFQGIDSYGTHRSVYPNGATPISSGPIRDAHATIFSVGPSTVLHASPEETTRYVAPDGTLRALVDYRVDLPDSIHKENETVTWDLDAKSLESVRFGVDSRTRKLSQSSTPAFDYSLEGTGSRTLWVQATVSVTLEKTTEIETGNRTLTEISHSEYRVTVRDAIDVQIYRPSYDVAVATTPGETGLVAVNASQPYVGYRVATDPDESVRNVWRFYTTGSEDWQRLTTTGGTRETTAMQARPIVVHAYPARMQPTEGSLSRSVSIREDSSTWTESDAPTLPSSISVDSVESTYRRPTMLVTDHDHSLANTLLTRGLVAGTTSAIDIENAQQTGELRPTDIETTVRSTNETAVVVSVVVSDTTTNTSIRSEGTRGDSVGVLVSDGREYPIDTDGTTTVTVPARGVSVVSYQPVDWGRSEITYLPSSERVVFHPLTDLAGWVQLCVDVARTSAPMVVVFVAGKQLGRVFRGERRRW